MRSTFLWVLGGTLLVLGLGVFGPALFYEPKPARNLPWQVENLDGTTRVFGVTLGRTTLEEMEQAVAEGAKVSLFREPGGEVEIEAFFEKVNLSGLGAKLVATFDLPEEVERGMFERGIRISTLGSGTRRVTLNPEDLAQVRRTPVDAITYLPSVSLEPEFVQKRFGEPAQRIAEADRNVTHWLYPERGIDVVLSEEQKELIQYVQPEDFEKLVAPLTSPQPQGERPTLD